MDANIEKYAILQSLTFLEEQYLKGNCNDESKQDYITATNELINQYNILINGDNDLSFLTTIHNNKHYKLTHTAYEEDLEQVLKLGIRRINIGVNGFEEQVQKEKKSEISEEREETPITGAATAKNSKDVAQATSAFITLLDAIKLEYDTPETLHPLLGKVMVASQNIQDDFPGRSSLVSWLVKLNQMDNNDSLSIEERENLLCDVDNAYSGFFNSL